ncbi:MAG: AMP-binding protein, partial [bacterium]|nr:AMP-binding protein [bacterium]
PDYMIPSYFIKLDQMPVTQSGKVDRKALLRIETGDIVTGTVYEPPVTEVQKKLVEIWQEVLDVPQVGITDNFLALGGHSLKAILIVSRVHKQFKKELPLSQIFDNPTVEGLASYIGRAGENPYASIQPVEYRDHYPVSSAQNRLFVLQQMAPDSVVYNIPQVIRLEEEPGIPKMEDAFRELIRRHESLRTSFHIIGGRPVQRVHHRVEFAFSPAADISGFFRPFDLSAAPLARAGIFKTETGNHILLVDIHHIISDAYSKQVLAEDFLRLYNGEELPPLRLQYKDFSQWQAGWKETAVVKQQETWWLKELGGELPVLNMPVDFPRPAIFSFEGSSIGFEIGTRETRALKELARSERVTPFILLLALYNVLLSRLCGQEDIIVGTPAAGRRHADLERIIGMFVNTVALRNYPTPGKTFGAFLADVRRRSLDAFENQEYPFEDLVEKVRLEKDISRNPVFDVAFSFFDTGAEAGESPVPSSDAGQYRYENPTTKFDMTLYSFVFGDRISCIMEYGTSLFKEETIRRFIRYFRQVVSTVTASPQLRITEIDIVPGEEKAWLLSQLTDTGASFPGDRTIQRIFEEQVEKTPHRTALVHMTDRSYMTYAQLDKKSNRVARHLRERGAGPDTITAMVMERDPGMIVGILGILKAGGAYLPIDPEYPQDRIDYMLKDSNAKIVLDPTHPALRPRRGPSNRLSRGDLKDAHSPANLAYIIYTSGSTGRPKGVMIEHSNVVRLLFNDKFQFDFNEDDAWTLFHSYTFDFSVWEMYGALLYGGKLIIIPRMTARDPRRFLEVLVRENVSVLNQTPSAFYNLVQRELEEEKSRLNLKYVIFGGEALSPGKLKQWYRRYPRTKLVNMFGITETTVHVTYKETGLTEIEGNISNIGKPIPT